MTLAEQFRSIFSLFFILVVCYVSFEPNALDSMAPKASFLCLTLLLQSLDTALPFSVRTSSASLQSNAASSNGRGSSSTQSTWQLWAGSDGLSGDDASSPRKVTDEGNEADEFAGRFAVGDELKRLRADLESLRENLCWAEAMEDQDRTEDLSKAIRNGENRDPDIVYRRALRGVIDAKASFKLSEEEKQRRVKKWQKEASAARRHLPRFQMEGLWVGK